MRYLAAVSLIVLLASLLLTPVMAQPVQSGVASVYFAITQSTAFVDISFSPAFASTPTVTGYVDCNTNVVFTVTAAEVSRTGARLKVEMNRSMHPPGRFKVVWTAQ